jgi:hypothetical protein
MSAQRHTPDLTALNAAVTAAAERDRQRLDEGLPQPVLPLVSLLDDRGVRAVWNVVRLLSDRQPALCNSFIGEVSLFHSVLDRVEEHKAGDHPMLHRSPVALIGWATLVDQLAKLADRRWLVAIPLANARTSKPYTELASERRSGSGRRGSDLAAVGPAGG